MSSVMNMENAMLLSAFNNIIASAKLNPDSGNLERLSKAVEDATTPEQRFTLSVYTEVMEYFPTYSDENVEYIVSKIVGLINQIESVE